MTLSGNLAYDVLVNDPPPQDGLLPNGEPKRFSPQASTLIYGSEEAVLTDPGLTAEQARAVGDWVEGTNRAYDRSNRRGVVARRRLDRRRTGDG